MHNLNWEHHCYDTIWKVTKRIQILRALKVGRVMGTDRTTLLINSLQSYSAISFRLW